MDAFANVMSTIVLVLIAWWLVEGVRATRSRRRRQEETAEWFKDETIGVIAELVDVAQRKRQRQLAHRRRSNRS